MIHNERGAPDGTNSWKKEQARRCQSLFAHVVMAALDDAIHDQKRYGNGVQLIRRWARSRDGREVLSCAGIEPNEQTVKGLQAFVEHGITTYFALSGEESKRRQSRTNAHDEL